MTQIRRMTGVCPQQNILFDDLSVKEHLRFVGMIKGMTGEALDAEVGNTTNPWHFTKCLLKTNETRMHSSRMRTARAIDRSGRGWRSDQGRWSSDQGGRCHLPPLVTLPPAHTYPPPVNRVSDTYLWKHDLRYAGGNNCIALQYNAVHVIRVVYFIRLIRRWKMLRWQINKTHWQNNFQADRKGSCVWLWPSYVTQR